MKVLEGYVNQTVMDFFLDYYPFTKLTTKLLDQMVLKCPLMLNGIDALAIKMLYHFEQLFFQPPIKYTAFFEKLWTSANRAM
jgi:hypothetical protein